MNVEAECLKAGVKPSLCCEKKQKQVYGVQLGVQRSPALCTKKCTLRILSITHRIVTPRVGLEEAFVLNVSF